MAQDLPPGTVLSSLYRVGLLVGRGGMGSVYEGMRLADGTRVALKVLSDRTRSDPSAVQRFEIEAQAASSLGHPNIVRVLDFKRNPNEPVYLVMEFLEGHSLGDEIESAGPLDLKRIAAVARDALAALAVAHRASIVHRDIKPDNIVLLHGASNVVAKLVDFGVAKMVGAEQHLTQAGQVIGTPAYMAPEQWHGRAIDARTDLFALGGCMYHALIGRPAVASAVEALEPGFVAARALEMPKVRPDVPSALAQVIAKSLAVEPRDRFGSADEMSEALSAVLPASTALLPVYRPTGHPTAPPPTAPSPVVQRAPSIPSQPIYQSAPPQYQTPPPQHQTAPPMTAQSPMQSQMGMQLPPQYNAPQPTPLGNAPPPPPPLAPAGSPLSWLGYRWRTSLTFRTVTFVTLLALAASWWIHSCMSCS